ELDGVPDGGIVELAAQTVQDFELAPDRGRLLGALARTDDFERVQLLALLFENGHDVGGGAGAERHEQEFHRAGSLVGLAVGIEGYGVARGAGGHEFLFANPRHGCALHAASFRQEYQTRGWDREARVDAV